MAWLVAHETPALAGKVLRTHASKLEPEAAVALEALLAQRTAEVGLLKSP